MPQPKKAGRFGGTAAHHNMLMANLATELIRHGRIRTTHAKAKTVQPLAEKMITFGKRGDLTARREVLRVIRDKDVVHKLFTDVGPAFADRDGGYTRVLKLGPRKGDAAPMALIELVEGAAGTGGPALDEAPRRRWSLRRRQGTLSATAQARAEDRAAAVDRGEEPEFEVAGEDDEVDAAETGPEPEPGEGLQADPAEVEARLAAQDEAEASDAEPSAEDADAEEPSAEDADAEEPSAEDADAEEPSAEEIAEHTDSASPTADDDQDEKD